MTYLLRYTPEAMRDMDAVWDGVYETSKNVDIADKYVKEFTDKITEKNFFRFLEYLSFTEVCLRDFIPLLLNSIRPSIV